VFRLIFYLLVTVFLITVVRGVLGVVLRGLSQVLSAGQAPKARPTQPSGVPLSGELKKDPSCGTYISAAASIKQSVGGETYHFCSAECRDKYVASLAR
jgi:YHS domain-containing protein